MYTETTGIVYQRLEIVYPMARDRLIELIPYMPNVREIEVIQYERLSESRVEIINHWHSEVMISSVLKSFIGPDFFSWKDYALWKDDEKCVDYRLESFVANDLFELTGTNYYVALDNDTTKIKITFNLTIYPERLPGIPGFLSKKLQPAIEDLIRRILTPNLNAFAQGLDEYFRNNN